MKKSSLIRAFLSIVIVALGGVLLLKNLEIINISLGYFLGYGLGCRICIVWAGEYIQLSK